MKKKKTLPKFKNDQEIAEFWATHDFTDYLHEFEEVDELEEPEKNTELISIRVTPSMMKILRRLARSKGIGYSPYARMLLLEGIKKEVETTVQS
ncbi:CopG family antitoxin [candidate division CSSED10-310 bacterium]|uniref:CopG family antitoxin n=1 Tax=candidate division CSSED10-310 bacterium TaxID=2855610 RepID=A0ABV6Z3N3_UNCC1